MKIIKINIFTWYFLVLACFCGFIKEALIIFFIVLFHEFGHVFFIKVFGYEIKSINIYPFGGITKINKEINTPIKKELIIALGGVIFQIFIYLLTFLLPFRDFMASKILFYNTSILIFNLLPIIPLDGSIILNSIYTIFFPFKKSYMYTFFSSLVFLLLFSLFLITKTLNNIFLLSFFIFKLIAYWRNYNFIYNRFLLERYLKDYKFKKLSSKKGPLDILKKDTYQYFLEDGGVKGEKTKLRERFDKR